MSPRGRARGFTLIEVLIAITITGMIGVGTYQLFSRVLMTQEAMETRSEKLERLQRTMAFLSRDFQQLAPRPIRNEYGDYEFALSNRNTLYLVELTRFGWRNPLLAARSEMQRVSYELDDEGKLYRNYYRVLDRAQDSQPLSQELLDKVQEVTLRFLNGENKWQEYWPNEAVMGKSQNQGTGARYNPVYETLPRAIEIRIQHEEFGVMTRLFEIAGREETGGFGENPSGSGGNNVGGNQDGGELGD